MRKHRILQLCDKPFNESWQPKIFALLFSEATSEISKIKNRPLLHKINTFVFLNLLPYKIQFT